MSERKVLNVSTQLFLL